MTSGELRLWKAVPVKLWRKAERRRAIQSRDLRNFAGDAAGMLKERIVEKDGFAGWHNNFQQTRIGTTGSALPLTFLRRFQPLTPVQERKVVDGIVKAQESDGGWAILSHSGRSSVEGTAPCLSTLLTASGPGVRDAIASAYQWLIDAQREDGSWGSTKLDAPRVTLTVSAILALSGVAGVDRSVLVRASEWLKNGQRSDGSWGPAGNEPSTVLHTALAVRGLIFAGVKADESHLIKGKRYIVENWNVDQFPIIAESYDAFVSDPPYIRTALKHDESAEVVLSLLEVDPLGLTTPIWRAASSWLDDNGDSKWFSRADGGSPSLWTVVPRAEAAAQLAGLMPSDDAATISSSKSVAFMETGNRLAVVGLALNSLRVVPGKLHVFGIWAPPAAAFIGAIACLLGVFPWDRYVDVIAIPVGLFICALLTVPGKR